MSEANIRYFSLFSKIYGKREVWYFDIT